MLKGPQCCSPPELAVHPLDPLLAGVDRRVKLYAVASEHAQRLFSTPVVFADWEGRQGRYGE